MMRSALTAMLAISALAPAAPAIACSPVPGYVVPTNLDLAVAGETIVLATVESQRKGEDEWSGAVVVRPTLLIKGSVLPVRVELEGAGLATRKWKARRSDSRELRRPNSDALSGGCVRYVFAKGTQLVLFLKRGEDGKLEPYRRPFSRDAARLEARIAELRAVKDDPDAAAIADDLQIELSGARLPPYD